MKKNLRLPLGVVAGLIAAIGFSSCAYDPYYGSTTVGGSYTSGYGGDYYGSDYGSGGSTSVFIATGNPRWGYDPSCYSYYDYTRRCYYDPYLNGYYPVGYRPPVVYGVSHPYGWRPGSRYCRPPGHVSNVTITNYRNRESVYRERGYVQASHGRQRQEAGPGRAYDQRPSSGHYGNSSYGSRTNTHSRSSTTPSSRQQPGRNPSAQPSGQRSGSSDQRGGAQPASRYPSRYNTPVAASQPQSSRENRSMQGDPRNRQAAERQVRQLAPPDQTRGNRQEAQPQRSQGRSQSRGNADKDDTRNNGTDPRGRVRN